MRVFQILFCVNLVLFAILRINDHFEFFCNIKRACGIAEFGFAMNTIYLIVLNIVTLIKPPDTSMDSTIYILVNLLKSTTFLCIFCVASFVVLFFFEMGKRNKVTVTMTFIDIYFRYVLLYNRIRK